MKELRQRRTEGSVSGWPVAQLPSNFRVVPCVTATQRVPSILGRVLQRIGDHILVAFLGNPIASACFVLTGCGILSIFDAELDIRPAQTQTGTFEQIWWVVELLKIYSPIGCATHVPAFVCV